MSVATYTKTGNKATTPQKLDKQVFGENVQDHSLLKQAYLAYLSNDRKGSAVVKTRGLVRGGGKKPWRQKGTGRARFGSIRNPIWRGGGIVFGPTGNENHTRKLSKQSKHKAIRQALTMAMEAKKISVVDSIEPKNGKTAEMAGLLKKMNLDRNVLVVTNDSLSLVRQASGNLPAVKVIKSQYLNVYDLLNADNVLFTKEALSKTTEWLGEAK